MRLLLLIVSAMVCVNVAAQEEKNESQSVKIDTVSLEEVYRDLALIKESLLNKEPPQEYYVAWNGKQKERGIYIYPVLDISAGVLSHKKQSTDPIETNGGSSDPSSTTSVGFEFGGTIIFVPGRVVGDSLRINKLGFAFSGGFLTSVASSDRYGAICNIIGKTGVEIGNQHFLGFGCDLLAGYGRLPGDLILYEDGQALKDGDITPYNKWSFIYGTQFWFKAGLVRIHKGVDVITYVRLMKAVDSGSGICSSPQPHLERLHKSGWSVGVLFRLKI